MRARTRVNSCAKCMGKCRKKFGLLTRRRSQGLYSRGVCYRVVAASAEKEGEKPERKDGSECVVVRAGRDVFAQLSCTGGRREGR